MTYEELIEIVVKRFFEGIKALDCELIKSAFHPASNSFTLIPHGVCIEPIEAWDDLINRAAEDPRHIFRQACRAQILAVDVEGTAAAVKATWNFGKTEITDFYNMLKTENG